MFWVYKLIFSVIKVKKGNNLDFKMKNSLINLKTSGEAELQAPKYMYNQSTYESSS